MKNLFKALAAFQQEVPIIHKGTEGYGYSYASLSSILEVINPIMAKHKLGFTQLGENGGIKTVIFHESGERLESFFEIPAGVSLKGMNQFQVLGSAVTYIRRYALSSALGLVTDVDNDANEVNEVKGHNSKQAQTPSQQPQKRWFNPLTKDGAVTMQGLAWQKTATEKGKQEAIRLAKEKYRVSGVTLEWMNNFNN